MKNVIKMIILLAFTYCHANGQNAKGFILNGNIEGVKDGTTLYLITRKVDTIAKTKSKGSTFKFEGRVEGNANYYFLQMDTLVKKGASNALWLINGPMSVKGSLQEFKQLTLNGSEPHDEFREQIGRFTNKINPNNKALVDDLKKWVFVHNNSLYVSDLILKIKQLYKPNELLAVYERLSPKAKNSYWGLELGQYIETQKRIAKTSQSGRIPGFYVQTVNGEKMTISELAAKSKYTLIDFWASWCSPCRDAIPKLKKVYERFHDQGFNIVGISTDKSEVAWKKALAEDKTPWIHTLDNIDNADQDVFGIVAIPGYILVDQNGKIIQSDILTQTGFNPLGDSQIKRFKNKSLSKDLYEIIETLLKEENGK